jgi:hypothetical protein
VVTKVNIPTAVTQDLQDAVATMMITMKDRAAVGVEILRAIQKRAEKDGKTALVVVVATGADMMMISTKEEDMVVVDGSEIQKDILKHLKEDGKIVEVE